MILVSIIEDDHDIREALALLISGSPGFDCAGAYPDCREAFSGLAQHPPDVLLLDIELPGGSGIAAIPALRERAPDMEILMLTVHDDEQLVFDALCAGASGYLLKTTPPGKLLSALEEIHRGGAPMSAPIARRVIRSFRRAPARESGLTPRETEILALLCQGDSYKMIADRLNIAHGTVHGHIKRIYRKLQVNCNASAVAHALKERLV